MLEVVLRLFILFVFLTAGNFAYQMLQDVPEYLVAIERSYFQLIAFLVVYFLEIRGLMK